MQYAKFLAAVAAAMLTGIVAALSDNVVTSAEWLQIIVAGAGAVGVYAIPNKPRQDSPVRDRP